MSTPTAAPRIPKAPVSTPQTPDTPALTPPTIGRSPSEDVFAAPSLATGPAAASENAPPGWRLGAAKPGEQTSAKREVTVSRTRFRSGDRRGTTVTFWLGAAATVEISVRSIATCEVVRAFRVRGHAGRNTLRFRGRARGKPLRPGVYRLEIRTISGDVRRTVGQVGVEILPRGKGVVARPHAPVRAVCDATPAAAILVVRTPPDAADQPQGGQVPVERAQPDPPEKQGGVAAAASGVITGGLGRLLPEPPAPNIPATAGAILEGDFVRIGGAIAIVLATFLLGLAAIPRRVFAGGIIVERRPELLIAGLLFAAIAVIVLIRPF